MIIMKFGGTSVGTPETIKKVIKIVTSEKNVGAVVVSAYAKVTDQLVKMSRLASSGNKSYEVIFSALSQRHLESVNKLIKNTCLYQESIHQVHELLNELKQILLGVYLLHDLSKKAQDLIISFGERLSAYIIIEAFKAQKISAEFVDARKLIKTNSDFGHAKVNFEKTDKNINDFYQKSNKNLKIITGFIASNEQDETTTLGRGGSDYTASIFGAATRASKIEIWTDVDGVMDADPRKTRGTKSIDQMTYKEAMEMSHFGAKVIFPSTMIPAMEKNIPIIIKNTFNPSFPGTVICEKKGNKCLARGISSISNVTLILIQGSGMIGATGIAARFFGALAKNNVNVILITQASSEYSICIAINPAEKELAEKAVNHEFKHEISDKIIDKPIIKENHAIIALVGENMRHTPGIAGRLFAALGNNDINIVAIAQGSSERNISTVIESKDEIKALNIIHKAFFYSPLSNE